MLTKHPCTVITVSHHAANRVNKAVIQNMFQDSDIGKIPAYHGLRMITKNIDKLQSVVNGRIAEVVQMEGNTVILQLSNQTLVHVFPLSLKDAQGNIKTVHPLIPAYELTIPKSQGQTLEQSIVGLDNPLLHLEVHM